MGEKTKKMTMLAIMAAAAYAVMVVGRIPMVLFLKYDPKDIILIITGFLFGPFSAFLVILVVCLIEMFTVTDTWIIGFIMDLLSSCSFVCIAAYIYKRNRTMKGAVIGLAAGCLIMTSIMLLWNYLMVPLYTSSTREAVKGMLLPIFLPFNLLKGGINLSVALIIYKPVAAALRKAQLIPPSKQDAGRKGSSIAVTAVSGFILVTCILIVLAMNEVI